MIKQATEYGIKHAEAVISSNASLIPMTFGHLSDSFMIYIISMILKPNMSSLETPNRELLI